MVKLNLVGNLQDVREGIHILSEKMGFELTEEGITVQVEQALGEIRVSLKDGHGQIRYTEKIHFFRALGLFIEHIQTEKEFELVEEPQFTMNGTMVDASRNGVMTVTKIKELLTNMATMGLNMLMLYTEETYTIEGEPYFGYMRGRYSEAEIKECDAYAETLGIELIPCIQTLAHLEQYLKWTAAAPVKDTSTVLLVDYEPTYQLIEKMIKTVAKAFRTNKVHIGMDEAWGLGTGRYLNHYGYRDRFDIMTDHLNRVLEITQKYELEPMIWADMFFRLASKERSYYDLNAKIPDKVYENIPEAVKLVYWDYYHNTEEEYADLIQKHYRLGSDVAFAGGIWTWNGIAPNYSKSFLTTNAALTACKKAGVKEVWATMWGDNGQETNHFSALLGLQLYAEHGYAQEVDEAKLKRRFKFCTGGDYDSFMLLDLFDHTPGADQDGSIQNPSKFLLWADILIGLFDQHVAGLGLGEHYAKLEMELNKAGHQNPEWELLFNFYEQLARVLKVKSEISLKLKEAYDQDDRQELAQYAETILPELAEKVSELRATHRKHWFETYKPFGWEVLDLRYGGVLSRIDTAIHRLDDYLAGRVSMIEELAEERLHCIPMDESSEEKLGRYNQYFLIATPNNLG